jgi:hypothetical protein
LENFENVHRLALWMVDHIGKNKTLVMSPDGGADWDWIASEVWRAYPGIFNEFVINDAIDFLCEAAQMDEE